MNLDNERKITYILTYGEDNLEIATIPFILSNGAMAMDVTPVIILQSNAVMLAVKGFAEKVKFKEGVSLKGAIIVGAARVSEEFLSSVNVVTY